MTSLKQLANNVVLLTALAILGGCATNLTTDVDQSNYANFSDYKTYAWIDDGFSLSSTQAPSVANPLNHQRIETAIDSALAKKGYRRVSADKADIVIAGAIGANQQLRVSRNYNSLGYYGGHNRFFGRGLIGTNGLNNGLDIQTYREGVLVLDVFETKSKEAVWHGSAMKRLNKKYTPPQLIDEAVMTLLESFPNIRTQQPVQKDRMS